MLLLGILMAILYFIAFAVAVYVIGEQDTSENADVIIVLGAGLLEDGRPGPALSRRSRHAATLWHKGIAPLVLCTGGQTEYYPRTEASACREILAAAGLPIEAVLMEEQSHSTEENALFSRTILDEFRLERVVLVSDSGHMLRARWLFHQKGIDAFASPVPTRQMRNSSAIPYALVREFIAFNWQIFKQIFNIPLTHVSGI